MPKQHRTGPGKGGVATFLIKMAMVFDDEVDLASHHAFNRRHCHWNGKRQTVVDHSAPVRTVEKTQVCPGIPANAFQHGYSGLKLCSRP